MKIGTGLAQADDVRSATIEAAMTASKPLDGQRPSLAVMLVSESFAANAQAALDALHEAVGPERVIGCVSETVIGDRVEAEEEPAVSVWLATTPAGVSTFHVRATGSIEDPEFEGCPHGVSTTRMLIADPFTFPVESLFRRLEEKEPGTLLVGGFASGGRAPGETRLFIDDRVEWAGAVGAELEGCEIVTSVSQGCRPVGRVLTVTRSEGNIIFELGGKSPLEQIRSLYGELDEQERALVSHGLLLGRVIDEYKSDFGRGDFLVRSVTGLDPENGAIAVGEQIGVGATVQFHVRDAASAHEDLETRLESVKRALGSKRPTGALLFTCNGRGSRMFGAPGHDAAAVSESLQVPLAGFFAAGEIGPVGGKNFVHGFTASLALFLEH
jgi:small ligand-binding sensory domain FIST